MRGSNVNVDSLEPSHNHVKYACETYGINHFATTIENYECSKSYDLITLFDTFEHLPNPHEVLNKCCKLLSDDGLLYIEIPDLRHPRVGSVGFFSAAHLFTYTPYTIEKVLSQCGFVVSFQDNNGMRSQMRVLARKKKRSDSEADANIPLDAQLSTIAARWQLFDNICVNVIKQIGAASSLQKIKDVIAQVASADEYMVPFVTNLSAMRWSQNNLNEAFQLAETVRGEFFAETHGVTRCGLATLRGYYWLNNRDLQHAEASLLEAESMLPNLSEIKESPLTISEMNSELNHWGYDREAILSGLQHVKTHTA